MEDPIRPCQSSWTSHVEKNQHSSSWYTCHSLTAIILIWNKFLINYWHMTNINLCFFFISRVSVIRQYSFSIYYLWLETISPSWISCIYVSKKFLATAFLIKQTYTCPIHANCRTNELISCVSRFCLLANSAISL